MIIKVNDITYNFTEEKLSITEILKKMNYTFPIIVVKHNDKVVDSEQYDTYYVHDNDELIIMHIFAGG